MKIFISTENILNKFFEFKIFPNDDETEKKFILFNDYLVDIEGENNIYIDFDLDEAVEENVFSEVKIGTDDMTYYLKILKQFLIDSTIELLEEVYIHEKTIQRNITTLKYIIELIKVNKIY